MQLIDYHLFQSDDIPRIAIHIFQTVGLRESALASGHHSDFTTEIKFGIAGLYLTVQS